MKNFTQQNIIEIVNYIKSMISSNEQHLSAISSAINAPVEPEKLTQIIGDIAKISRDFAANAHRLKMYHDWSISPNPEWFDHFIDQFFQTQNSVSLWMERGVYSVLALRRGGKLLELCCGDGYNTKTFYSPLVESIIALDFDESAISHAQQHHQAPNISFQRADIRTGMPTGIFDNIVWDAAIEHFTETEIAALMAAIKERLGPQGILSGYTLVESADGHKHLHQHEREFRSKEDLCSFLTPYFANVRVFETIHPTRHNLYFYASDAAAPFDADWHGGLSIRTNPAGTVGRVITKA